MMSVDVTGREKISVPQRCACCGAGPPLKQVPSTYQVQTSATTSTSHTIHLPYCQGCYKHSPSYWQSVGCGAVVVCFIFGSIAALGGAAITKSVIVAEVIGAIAVAGIVGCLWTSLSRRMEAKKYFTPGCTTRRDLEAFLYEGGSVTAEIYFTSDAYAKSFAEANITRATPRTEADLPKGVRKQFRGIFK